jgi:hypothetical protein
MTNEVTISVQMVDDTAATRAKVKAQYEEWAAGFGPIGITAKSPIDEAWQAQVAADVRATDPGEVTVGVTADTAAVAGEVAEARARVEAEVQPVVIPVEAGQVPDLAAQSPGNQMVGAPYDAAKSAYYADLAQQQEAQVRAAAEAYWQSEGPIQVPMRAADPINEAWIAQVKSSVRGIANDALEIPLNPGLAGFEAQLEAALAQLSATTKLDIPADVGDAMAFRDQVQMMVEQVERSVKAVIDVQVNNTEALTELQQKTAAASQATLAEVEAQQKLNQAYASGDADKVAKATQDLESAEKGAKDATEALTAAQAAAAEGSAGLAAAEDVAAGASRGLGAAMGPVWMAINVAQMAMFAFGNTSSSTAQQTQDMSQQLNQLGQSAGTAAQGLVGGNQNLQGIAGDLETLGTNATQFQAAYSGSLDTATQYTNRFVNEQKQLASTPVNFDENSTKQMVAALGEGAASAFMIATNIKQLTDAANANKAGFDALPEPLRKAVAEYRALGQVVPQAQDDLNSMTAAADASKNTLAGLGYVMTDGQTVVNNYGLTVQSNAKALSDATAGAAYLENAVDKASIAAGQGAQQWAQLQAAVASAGQQVENASHSIVTAEQGVESARHSEEQAALAVTAAQHGYANALYQEGQAQQAVTSARQAAQAALVSLQLQANDAATSALSANVSLFDAQQSAAALGVNPGNAQQIAAEQVTAANEAQVKAAIALIQAQNQVADSQNASTDAQNNLNTARQQGVDNNPAVLSAEHSLAQAQDAVTTSAQGVTNAQWAQQQAAIAVGNAQWGVVQAEQGLTTAEQNLTTAQDAASRSTDQNTLAGAQNRQMIEQLFEAYRNEYGNEQIAAAMTQEVGQKMHFTADQIGGVIASVNGLNGQVANFSIVGTPSMDPTQLVHIAQVLGMGNDFSAIESALPDQSRRVHNAGARAGGGPGGGLTWVGEQGAELVDLPPGTEVITNANSMMMVANGDVLPPGHASGGPVGADVVLAANLPLAAQWGAVDVMGQVLHAMGGPAVNLPPPGPIDWGAFGGRPGSVPGGHGAVSGLAAEAQAYAASQLARYGWSGDQMPPLIDLWNQESGWNPYAVNPSSGAYGIPQCYTLDALILTRRGWLRHDEVQVGDETIGYNQATGRSEWTTIDAVLHPGVHRVVRYGNSRVHFTTTPNHRWLMLNEHKHTESFVQIQDRLRRHTMLLSKEACVGAGSLDITDNEAALLGWIAGDGWQEKARVKPRRTPDRGRKNWHRSMTYRIAQTKEANWDSIEKAIDGNGTISRTRQRVVHGVVRRDREWRLSAPYARDLTERAGNPKVECLSLVLRMSDSQRKAWLDAVFAAEGSTDPRGHREISQCEGDFAEAIRLAIYLEGYRPAVYRDRRYVRTNLRIGFVKPTLVIDNPGFFYEDIGEAEVWCVSTKLGSFTAKQNGHVHLTGNSLGHGHPYDLGDYVRQVDWGLNYIAGRYGSPMAAEAHERAHHWYGGGGPASGVVGVGDRGPELARIPGAASASAAQQISVDVNVNFVGNTDSAYATGFMRMVREGQIQLTAHVNGQTGTVKVK